MAELSTIARPYAHAMLLALQDANKGPEEAADLAAVLDGIAQVVTTPELVSVIGDPKLSSEQIYDLIIAGLGQTKLPEEAVNLLKVVVENGRLEAVPEIARQFRELKNQSEGVADAYIESAMPMTQAEVDDLVAGLGKRFPGLKLTPVVTINEALIGGVRVRVGDRVLDGSIQTRLAQMQFWTDRFRRDLLKCKRHSPHKFRSCKTCNSILVKSAIC